MIGNEPIVTTIDILTQFKNSTSYLNNEIVRLKCNECNEYLTIFKSDLNLIDEIEESCRILSCPEVIALRILES